MVMQSKLKDGIRSYLTLAAEYKKKEETLEDATASMNRTKHMLHNKVAEIVNDVMNMIPNTEAPERIVEVDGRYYLVTSAVSPQCLLSGAIRELKFAR